MELDKMIKAGVDPQLAAVSSPYIFALTVKDEGMLPDLKPGDIVIIDPVIKPKPGEIVLAKLATEELLLRKYRPLENPVENNQSFCPFELIAANALYPNLTISHPHSGRIIGTLIEHRCHRRLLPPWKS